MCAPGTFGMSRYSVFVLLLAALVLASCGTGMQETVRPGPVVAPHAFKEAPEEIPPATSLEDTAPPPNSPLPAQQPQPLPRTGLSCSEDTGTVFNRSGLAAMPFMRAAFLDIDRDGSTDMIAGSRDGHVLLYRNRGGGPGIGWEQQDGYFDGVSAGAFATPAVGDLDGDGLFELVIGTGGFSSGSGRVLIYRNLGSVDSPRWDPIEGIGLSAGLDAAVTIVDYDFDGRPDIIAGNAEGRIIFFRNMSGHGQLRFRRDPSPLGGRSFGMYAVPAAIRSGNRVFLVIGNDKGRLFMFRLLKNGQKITSAPLRIALKARSFASPSFAGLTEKDSPDLVVADGDGALAYYENLHGDFSVWAENRDIFGNRILAGPACAPALCLLRERELLVIGTIDGTLMAYEQAPEPGGLPWQRKRILEGIRLNGFSRGIITEWKGKDLLIAGQGTGRIRAFLNLGTPEMPRWQEEERFFDRIPAFEHAAPTVFDLDRDGRWELVTGAADGRIYGYRIEGFQDGLPVWERIAGVFDHIKVEGFSVPTLARDNETLYLFTGQEDGRIRSFEAALDGRGAPLFRETAVFDHVRMKGHSSPFARLERELIEVFAGDYDGNLRHFKCGRSELVAGNGETAGRGGAPL